MSPGRAEPSTSPPARPCAAPHRPARGMSGFWTRQVIIPRHALHEKGLQRQISVGTLVSSQERRALAVPLINRLSTACQPRVNRGSTADFVLQSVYIGFRLFVLPKKSPGQYLRFAGGQERGLFPVRVEQTASRPCPTQPRPPSPPRRAPPRPDWPVCPGFDSTGRMNNNTATYQ